jgi:hypothetical protein
MAQSNLTPHPYAEAIKAYADGYRVQFRVKPELSNYGSMNTWMDSERPEFHYTNFEWRIAPGQDDE